MTEYENFLARIVARKNKGALNIAITSYVNCEYGVEVSFNCRYRHENIFIDDTAKISNSDLFEQQFIDK